MNKAAHAKLFLSYCNDLLIDSNQNGLEKKKIIIARLQVSVEAIFEGQ